MCLCAGLCACRDGHSFWLRHDASGPRLCDANLGSGATRRASGIGGQPGSRRGRRPALPAQHQRRRWRGRLCWRPRRSAVWTQPGICGWRQAGIAGTAVPGPSTHSGRATARPSARCCRRAGPCTRLWLCLRRCGAQPQGFQGCASQEGEPQPGSCWAFPSCCGPLSAGIRLRLWGAFCGSKRSGQPGGRSGAWLCCSQPTSRLGGYHSCWAISSTHGVSCLPI